MAPEQAEGQYGGCAHGRLRLRRGPLRNALGASRLPRALGRCRSWRRCCTISLRRSRRCAPASRPRSTPSSRAASRRIRPDGTRQPWSCDAALEEFRASLSSPPQVRASRVTRPVVVALVLVALLAAGAATWLLVRASRVRWARQVGAASRSKRSSPATSPTRRYRLLVQVQRLIPDDPQLARLTNDVMDPSILETTPPGVDVATKATSNPAGEWLPLGTTPLKGALVPFGYRRWRLTKDGYEPRELAAGRRVGLVTLSRPGDIPAGMVYVAGAASVSGGRVSAAGGFLVGPLRSDEPAVQGLRRCRRLQPSGVLDTAVRQGWPRDLVGRRRRRSSAIPPAGPGPRDGSSARIRKGRPTSPWSA